MEMKIIEGRSTAELEEKSNLVLNHWLNNGYRLHDFKLEWSSNCLIMVFLFFKTNPEEIERESE